MPGISLHCQRQFNLFQRQYLQLQVVVTYPDPECLRQDAVQRLLLEQLFDERSIQYQPPQRYQIRVLKELTRRIEASVTDWEEEVCISPLLFTYTGRPSLTLITIILLKHPLRF
jgi:protein-lysine N-methyltransferase EEF2KMT